MMNQLEITSTEQFQEVIDSLEKSYNKLLDLFKSQQKNAEEINETDTWSGATAKVMYGKYKLLNSNYNHIEYSLDLYIKFLKKTLSDYNRLIEEINKNTDETAEALNVVS